MEALVPQIKTLNSFARAGDLIHETWASRDFAATYAAAVAACSDKLEGGTYGVYIGWSASRPETLNVHKRGMITERTEFSRDLPLEGKLGETLLSDLRALAVPVAAAQIEEERRRALLKEADARVAAMLQTTSEPALGLPA